jgi:hypothetical protein
MCPVWEKCSIRKLRLLCLSCQKAEDEDMEKVRKVVEDAPDLNAEE